MIRTQIQLPERLYEEAKQLAQEKEVSLTEIVRRGLELLLTIYPTDRAEKKGWTLDPPANTGLRIDPFENPDWRLEANQGMGTISLAAESDQKPAKKRRT
jgi:hypothetical protein